MLHSVGVLVELEMGPNLDCSPISGGVMTPNAGGHQALGFLVLASAQTAQRAADASRERSMLSTMMMTLPRAVLGATEALHFPEASQRDSPSLGRYHVSRTT